MEFLILGITQFDEPGVFVAFEETADDLIANVTSMGFDLAKAEADGKLVIDHVHVVRGEMEEAGEWDLDGLFLRLGAAIDAIGAKRVVIDTIETLFGVFSNTAILRSELQRLFGWLQERGVTSIITGERGDGTLTRHGIEEYVSDCVIVLDHRVNAHEATRRMRILKYRGSLHGTNEYPFLIGETGIFVQPVTSHIPPAPISMERVSTGVPDLDSMLDGGFFKGSTVLINGSGGTGKSILAAKLCDAACSRGERAMYFGYEETEAEIVRNMASVGIDLQQWANAGLLRFKCLRPRLLGLEAHLFATEKSVVEFDPSVVVMDPISDLLRIGSEGDVSAMLNRKVDFLKARGITSMFTSLNDHPDSFRWSEQISSLADAWLLLKSVEGNGERNRILSVLKARGMAHSNHIRELHITSQGIDLSNVYIGPHGVLTGSAGQAQGALERSEVVARQEELRRRRASLQGRREAIETQTAALWREFDDETAAVEHLLGGGSVHETDRFGDPVESTLPEHEPAVSTS
jgi:circadian clock protein KaiC